MFKVGDRVKVKATGQEGMVQGCTANVPDIIGIGFDSDGVNTFYSSEELAHVAAKTDLVPFYMLLVDGTETCRKRHASIEAARTEAMRLLLQLENQGKGITILKAIEYGKLPEREVEWRTIGGPWVWK